MPDHPFVAKVMALLERPMTGTSANLTGSEPAQSGVEVQQIFRRQIPRPDLIVDAGMLPPSPASTVLDLTNPENPKILRMGAITKEKLDEILKNWERPKKKQHEAAA
jgi:L-threonylcarbamoyladenylate synthase